MDIRITANNFSLTPSLRTSIGKQMEKLEQHRSDIIGITVALTVEKHHVKGEKYRADARVFLPGKDLFALVRATDMRIAIDRVAEKLESQLRRGKDRRLERRRGNTL